MLARWMSVVFALVVASHAAFADRPAKWACGATCLGYSYEIHGAEYVMRDLKLAPAPIIATGATRAEAFEAFHEECGRRICQTVWSYGGVTICGGWTGIADIPPRGTSITFPTATMENSCVQNFGAQAVE